MRVRVPRSAVILEWLSLESALGAFDKTLEATMDRRGVARVVINGYPYSVPVGQLEIVESNGFEVGQEVLIKENALVPKSARPLVGKPLTIELLTTNEACVMAGGRARYLPLDILAPCSKRAVVKAEVTIKRVKR